MAHEALEKEGRKALRKDINPKEVEEYFLKKGMDKKEAKEEITKLKAEKIVADAKKAEKEKKANLAAEKPNHGANEKKSSLWVYIIILAVIVAAIYYLYSSGTVDIKNLFS